ncbi:hypothetical protein PC116_g3476 [Phytophthora cactorum]|uniref:Uncharacterized protein n=1 Tax=Phytophthora cactorum TaxID=29920 RepID=A0A8T1LJ54_9STRA|nr:hypothetical protein PC117_g18406 [Phytophthora cactorum]KAG2920132.1 hypothetical protein PC115_g9899 [Phytophthora cactorum]KAG3010179.1 hypothetical protein PC120_g15203 [Phytophthora cactorum]KAG3016908.1 hypothetical protein PC119_g11195 [Phytophthora cactorum]KAG3181665.1 hypothetical protein PC128_g15029 [Phytophthora cactorum]
MSYRGGKYSIERILALDEYTQKHSRLHTILVCVTCFLPAECFIISQEAVPLEDPALGWRENYGFWVRAALVIGAVLYTATIQAKYLLQDFVISYRQLLALLICVVVVQMILAVTFAANVWFPIPFTVITLVPAFYVVSITSICVVVGIPVIRKVLQHKKRLFRFGCFIAAQQFMAVIYPAYQVLFHAANTINTSYQLPVILLLPVIKLVVKNIALRCVTHLEDMMPEAVIFTVDFFNALYMATSMESATSTSTVMIIVLIDIIQSATVLFRLHRRTATILPRLKEVVGSLEGDLSLLSAACQIIRCVDKFQRQNRREIRVRSCLPHSLSSENRDLLNRLEAVPRTGSLQQRRRSAPNNKPDEFKKDAVFEKCRKISKGATWVERRDQSRNGPSIKRESQTSVQNENAIVTQHKGILRESLEVMFTVECILLSAFLDAFVPFFYGIFMYVMVNFQSAKYHSELTGVTAETIGDVIDSIFVFAVVELVALSLLAAVIYRNLGMNAAYHLAFVLETQTELIQSKLLGWVTMTLAFRVVHFGVDFSFKFAWLK